MCVLWGAQATRGWAANRAFACIRATVGGSEIAGVHRSVDGLRSCMHIQRHRVGCCWQTRASTHACKHAAVQHKRRWLHPQGSVVCVGVGLLRCSTHTGREDPFVGPKVMQQQQQSSSLLHRSLGLQQHSMRAWAVLDSVLCGVAAAAPCVHVCCSSPPGACIAAATLALSRCCVFKALLVCCSRSTDVDRAERMCATHGLCFVRAQTPPCPRCCCPDHLPAQAALLACHVVRVCNAGFVVLYFSEACSMACQLG
jgi:hypothetical protein